MTPAERRAAVTGQRSVKEILASKGAAKPADAPVAPPAAAPAAATPDPVPAAPAAGEGDPAGDPADGERTPERFRFKDPVDQAVALLAKTKGISLLEAARQYHGDNAPAAPAAPAAAPAAPAVDSSLAEYDTQITTLADRIKKLSDDRTKAREDVETDKADKLSDDIAEAKADLRLLEHERKGYVRTREQAAVQTAQQQVNTSRDRALSQYPDLQTEGSLHRLALDQYVTRALRDPARAGEFNDMAWPERLTTEFAQKHGLKKAGSAASTPAPAVPSAPAPAPAATPTPQPASLLRSQPRQVPGAKLVSSADGGSPSAPVPTADELRAALPQMTAAKRRELAVHAITASRRQGAQ